MNFTRLHLDNLKPYGKRLSSTCMDSKNLRITKHVLCALLAASPFCEVQAQPADPAPAEQPANELEALFSDAQKAFQTKDYATAINKLDTLLKAIATNKAVPQETLELIRFNIGLAHLLSGDGAKAEVAFTECVKAHPKGEYTSRCYLGIGRACILQGTPEKKEKSIEALKQAALDPKFRAEAGLSLGQVYNDLNRPEEAFTVFRSLMGSDVRTPQQTNAAVEVIGLLAASEKLDDLTSYLGRVINQSGIRDSIAWYSNQIIVKGDEIASNNSYEVALALYRSIPPRRQILETQRVALEDQRKAVAALEQRIASEAKLPIAKRSNAGEEVGNLKAALEMNTKALEAIEAKEDLDAALLLRRGRCLYYLDRFEEALVCFRTIRTQHPKSNDLEAAAYSEIFVYNQLKDTTELQKRATDFLQKHPNSQNLEQVAMLAGEGLANAGKWDEVLAFYKDLETKYPNSQSLDRYVFFQGVALFRTGKFADAGKTFTKFAQTFPNSPFYEDAMYQIAMANFVEGKYKETLASCQDYLKRFPTGRYSGDIRYRLAYIDFRDEEADQSKKIIKDINAFVEANPGDPSTGMMLNLLGDTYTQKKSMQQEKDSQDKALDAYKKALESESPDDVIRYATEQATIILQAKKDWAGLAELHKGIVQRRPNSPLALISKTWIVKMMVREGKGLEAAELLGESLKETIGDPANEQVEPMIDELVRSLVPKRVRGVEPDLDALMGQLNTIIDKAATGQESPTTNARKAYAGARLADMVRKPDRADLLLKGMAANTDPAVLSPMLLSAAGEILLKGGELDKSAAMFQRIVDRFQDSAFADSGPVGLARVEMARKEYQKALDLFTKALEEIPGMSRYREATVGKLEALTKLGKLDDAEKLGLEVLGDRGFKGESSGQAYLLLGDVYKAKASTKTGSEKEEDLRKANGYYINAFARFKAFPEIAADGLLRSYTVLTELGESDAAKQTLDGIIQNPKFDGTKAKAEALKK